MTTKTDTEAERALLPCPFCGGEAHFDSDDDGWNWIECGSCRVATNHRTSAMDDCRPLLAEAWNRRVALQSQDREDVKRPVLDSIVDEIHRRADKEWADDGYDFEVTITADEYKALCEEEKAIDHARRIEDKP